MGAEAHPRQNARWKIRGKERDSLDRRREDNERSGWRIAAGHPDCHPYPTRQDKGVETAMCLRRNELRNQLVHNALLELSSNVLIIRNLTNPGTTFEVSR